MDEVEKSFGFLKGEIEKREKRTILKFEEFLEIVKCEPQRVLRNIFQLFHDMVQGYVGEGMDEYPDDPESIGYVKYDCSKIFVDKADNPFFADRLFANRFVRDVKNLKQGSQQNQLYAYLGPHGCGKSTFMNNLLRAFEEYASKKAGQSFEIFWDIEIESWKVEVSCPSHDHPILIIPKDYRVDFLKRLLSEEMMTRIVNEKEYEWVRKEEPCTFCKSLFWALFDKLHDVNQVFNMIRVRSYIFDRRLGEGISIFNPGDASVMSMALMKPTMKAVSSNTQIQEKLDQMFGVNQVRHVSSQHAKTNNGIYVLMDIKSHNKQRLLELHNIITEGIHKVGNIEERIHSLFFALMNPEDKKIVEGKETESFEGRIQYNKIPYVLEISTEVKIYHSIFGKQIGKYFLPRILENFARVIIASRMKEKCEPLSEWIEDMEKYEKYCDGAGRLLRMEIYGGVIPSWLSEEDRKKFTAKIRRNMVDYGQEEGDNGFDGRESIRLFSKFFSRYGKKSNLINMQNVADYFKHKIGKDKRDQHLPKGFITSLINWYDYEVLNEVKESLYFYNKKQIREDILNYLCAINYTPNGSKIICKHTRKQIEITTEFFKTMAFCLTGEEMSEQGLLDYARDIQRKYAKVIAQDPRKGITKTELYQELLNSYTRNLKEKVLQPFVGNESFRQAVKSFGTEEFEACDTRLKERVAYMIKNLVTKFGYTEQGAKEVCLYIIDQKLVEKFS